MIGRQNIQRCRRCLRSTIKRKTDRPEIKLGWEASKHFLKMFRVENCLPQLLPAGVFQEFKCMIEYSNLANKELGSIIIVKIHF